MGELLNITQHECKGVCPWHKEGRDYSFAEIFPNVCPYLYHSLYPYFLGLLYGAESMQDIWVCCPAEFGVDTYVRKVDNRGEFDIPDDWWVIYAEVVKVNGDCPHGHEVGDKIVFPTCWKKKYICPAGVNNIFPFLDLEVPSCINKKRLRCTDWKQDVYYSIEDNMRTIFCMNCGYTFESSVESNVYICPRCRHEVVEEV